MEQRKPRKINDRAAYRAITDTFRHVSRRQGGGLTVADVVARTALPLETVKEYVNDVADEYSARLSVTESGEILYSFPAGFASRYRGFKAVAGRAFGKIASALRIAGVWLFKVWIMVMLVGYFALFMLIALAALALSVASSSSQSGNNRRGNSGGGLFFASGIFDFIIRIWFYSELAKTFNGRYYDNARQRRPRGKPLYKAVFSFVFGDGDPNASIETREKQAVISYIQANKGVISLPEFMVLTGTGTDEAGSLICAYCSEYGGMPEPTDDGTVVYRFDALLLRADRSDRTFGGFSAPLKQTRKFSSNETKMNIWFSVINSVNLIFGSYFLINALTSGHILTQRHFDAASYLYGVTYILMNNMMGNPLPVIIAGLGITPVLFSLFFWLIPLARYFLLKGGNEKIKTDNLRKIALAYIWDNPLSVTPDGIKADLAECRPKNADAARERVIMDAGQYSLPEVAVNGNGQTVYSFAGLNREKEALAKYRAGIKNDASDLGDVVVSV
ncbi:MAG: hypothetical protein LBH50_04435 [Spirochaetaceae bacterium]|jgi:hypothetical protein|nr:hypothetical protein [Spirochaetaceae bacterium]